MDQDGVVREGVVDAVLSASRVLMAMAVRSLGGVGEEVTLPQYRSLVILASRGPQSLASLAEALAVQPPTASRMCDRLVRKRLIRRTAVRRDRRQVRIALTETGRHLVDQVTLRRREEIIDILGSIPLDVQEAMAEGLHRMAAAAGEVPERDWSAGWDL
jgi:DNA-binding MarR family transcriptional regulator